jgi:Ethanolamine utilization protein EutJ (predicted chaperonin)
MAKNTPKIMKRDTKNNEEKISVSVDLSVASNIVTFRTWVVFEEPLIFAECLDRGGDVRRGIFCHDTFT